MKMPITSLAVMCPSGKKITIQPNPTSKTYTIMGLETGEIMVRTEEAFAIKQILGIMIE